MRTWLRLVGLAALALVAAAGAGAEQYNVTANAGNDGDSHLNNDDPDAEAEFVRSDVGTEVYRASANAAFGSLSASASRQDPLPPGVTTSSGASIEETIHFSELPAGSVTIRATLGVAAQATSATGVARASASLTLRGSTGDCTYSMTQNSVLGFQDSNGCAATGGSAGDGVVELTLTSDQLLASNAQVDIEANVSAQLENLGAGIDGSASASGGTGLSRGGEPPPGSIYLEIDPPLAHTFTGSQTFFLVPEPGSPWLLASLALVAHARRRR